MGAGLFGRGVLHEADYGHGGGVAGAVAFLEDAEVAAGAFAEAGAEFVEQLADGLLVAEAVEGEAAVGHAVLAVDYAFLVMLALVIVIGIQAAGIVLVMAMLVTPAATAYLLVRRFVTMMVVAAVLGAVAAVTGLYASYHFNLPAGPAMALVASGIFVLAVLFRRRATA